MKFKVTFYSKISALIATLILVLGAPSVALGQKTTTTKSKTTTTVDTTTTEPAVNDYTTPQTPPPQMPLQEKPTEPKENEDDDDDDFIAGFFLEPGVTYQISESSVNYPTPFSSSTGRLQGFGVSGRLGIHLAKIFFAGVDARYSMPRFEDSTNNLNSQAKNWDIGPVIGAQFPWFGLRGWAAYIPFSELDPEESNGFNYKFASGSGFRVGVGIRLSIVSLNLEYQKINYGNTTIQRLGPFTPNSDTRQIAYDGEGWIASLSFPLAL